MSGIVSSIVNFFGSSEVSYAQNCNPREAVLAIAQEWNLQDPLNLQRRCFNEVYRQGFASTEATFNKIGAYMGCLEDEFGNSLLEVAINRGDFAYANALLDWKACREEDLVDSLIAAIEKNAQDLVVRLWDLAEIDSYIITGSIPQKLANKKVTLAMCRMGAEAPSIDAMRDQYMQALHVMKVIDPNLTIATPESGEDVEQVYALAAQLYAVQRRWHCEDADVAKEFADTCFELGKTDPDTAMALLDASIKEQEKKAKCVFPSIQQAGKRIFEYEHPEMSEHVDNAISVCWGTSKLAEVAEYTAFYKLAGYAIDGAGKIAAHPRVTAGLQKVQDLAQHPRVTACWDKVRALWTSAPEVSVEEIVKPEKTNQQSVAEVFLAGGLNFAARNYKPSSLLTHHCNRFFRHLPVKDQCASQTPDPMEE